MIKLSLNHRLHFRWDSFDFLKPLMMYVLWGYVQGQMPSQTGFIEIWSIVPAVHSKSRSEVLKVCLKILKIIMIKIKFEKQFLITIILVQRCLTLTRTCICYPCWLLKSCVKTIYVILSIGKHKSKKLIVHVYALYQYECSHI